MNRIGLLAFLSVFLSGCLSRTLVTEETCTIVSEQLLNERVLIVSTSGEEFQGDFRLLNRDSVVWIDVRDSKEHAIPTSQVWTIQTNNRVLGGLGGFVGGFLVGGSIGLGIGKSSKQGHAGPTELGTALLLGVGAGVAGAVGGAIVGAQNDYVIALDSLLGFPDSPKREQGQSLSRQLQQTPID